MRPELDSEIDSLLRGHARPGGPPARAGNGALRPALGGDGGGGAVPHLDADEIAAFAEGDLPDASRSRYTAHLADCDDCRKLVTQITLAAGVADRIEERERKIVPAVSAAPTLRERLAALFAPRAWRYAMPVVALLAVSTVVLVVTKRLPREESAGQLSRRGESAAPQSAPVAQEAHHSGATPEQNAQGNAQGNDNTAAARPQGVEERQLAANDAEGPTTLNRQSQDEFAQPPATASTGGATAAPAPPVGAVAPKSAPELQPNRPATFATEPAALPSPVPPPALTQAQRSAILRSEIAAATATPLPPPGAEAEAKEKTRDDTRGRLARDEAPATKRHGPQRGMTRDMRVDDSPPAAASSRSARGSARQTREQSANDASRNEPEGARAEDRDARAETRSAGGRRFRRERGVWIDTAYKSSQATVVVRRNSEQYRALVADEPEIGRISRALGGEAVIVWKGRAYRIKP